jgi:hypothetical protein
VSLCCRDKFRKLGRIDYRARLARPQCLPQRRPPRLTPAPLSATSSLLPGSTCAATKTLQVSNFAQTSASPLCYLLRSKSRKRYEPGELAHIENILGYSRDTCVCRAWKRPVFFGPPPVPRASENLSATLTASPQPEAMGAEVCIQCAVG